MILELGSEIFRVSGRASSRFLDVSLVLQPGHALRLIFPPTSHISSDGKHAGSVVRPRQCNALAMCSGQVFEVGSHPERRWRPGGPARRRRAAASRAAVPAAPPTAPAARARLPCHPVFCISKVCMSLCLHTSCAVVPGAPYGASSGGAPSISTLDWARQHICYVVPRYNLTQHCQRRPQWHQEQRRARRVVQHVQQDGRNALDLGQMTLYVPHSTATHRQTSSEDACPLSCCTATLRTQHWRKGKGAGVPPPRRCLSRRRWPQRRHGG